VYSRTLTVLQQGDPSLFLDPLVEPSVQPNTLMGDHDDLLTPSVPGLLDSIAIPSTESGAHATDSADLSGPTENLEATLSLSLDGMHGTPSDPRHATHDSSEILPGNVKDLWLQDTIHLDGIKLSADFVKAL
jgi:hypothetical protein